MNATEITTKNGSTYTFYRAKNDVNGNPRYIIHFFDLVTDKDRAEVKGSNYTLRLLGIVQQKVKGKGITKYRGKDFGGGFVMQSYNLHDTAEYLDTLK